MPTSVGYGASFGGPIRKEKTFFFVTWERTGQLTSDTTTSTVPTALNRAGDFSDLRSSAGKPVLIPGRHWLNLIGLLVVIYCGHWLIQSQSMEEGMKPLAIMTVIAARQS